MTRVAPRPTGSSEARRRGQAAGRRRLHAFGPASHRPHLGAFLAALAVCVAGVLGLNVPYFTVSPGPTYDVLEVIQIDGARPSSAGGGILLTTVALRPIRVFQGVLGWLDSSTEVVERATVIRPGSTREEVDRRSSEQMQESHLNAAAAALSFLGHEVRVSFVGVRIDSVLPDTPAAGLLREGDVIVAAGGQRVERSEDLVRVVEAHEVGHPVALGITRAEDQITLEVPTVGRPEDPSVPIIGVVISNASQIDLPVDVVIDAGGVGGPSAGLMYALGIVDILDERDITGGRTVAGTGTISIDGEVGLVGGVVQKVRAARKASADLFLVPADELGDACRVAGDLRVVGVVDLEEAVTALIDEAFALSRGC